MLIEIKINETGKHVAAGLFAAAATFTAATFGAFLLYPLLTIAVIILLAPTALPFNNAALPFARETLRKYWLAMITASIATIIAISMTKYILIAALLFLHAAMSVFTRALKKNHIGTEIVTLIAVTSGVAYGAKIGAIAGGLAMLMDYIFSGRVSMFSIITIPTYALIGIIAGSFAAANILTLGIALTIFYNLFTWIFILGFMGGHLDKCLRFGATNLAFNAFIFSSIAPLLLSLMT